MPRLKQPPGLTTGRKILKMAFDLETDLCLVDCIQILGSTNNKLLNVKKRMVRLVPIGSNNYIDIYN